VGGAGNDTGNDTGGGKAKAADDVTDDDDKVDVNADDGNAMFSPGNAGAEGCGDREECDEFLGVLGVKSSAVAAAVDSDCRDADARADCCDDGGSEGDDEEDEVLLPASHLERAYLYAGSTSGKPRIRPWIGLILDLARLRKARQQSASSGSRGDSRGESRGESRGDRQLQICSIKWEQR
jgi:hypothetical protein